MKLINWYFKCISVNSIWTIDDDKSVNVVACQQSSSAQIKISVYWFMTKDFTRNKYTLDCNWYQRETIEFKNHDY